MRWRVVKRYLSSDWKKAASADLLLVCSDSDRSFQYQNRFYSPLLDSIGDIANSLGADCIRFSDRISMRVGLEAYQSPFHMNRQLLWFNLAKRLALKLGFDAAKVVRYLEIKESSLWIKVLTNVRPKLVIAIQPNGPLCLACHRQGIVIYDLQHGLISDTPDNPYYFSGRQYVFDEAILPSGFLCWDENSKKVLGEIKHFAHQEKRVIGNPWFGRFADNRPDDALVQSERAKLPSNDVDKPVILVTLQHCIGEFAGDYVTDGVMVDALNQVIKQTAHSYIWLLRLHPSQMVGAHKQELTAYLKHHFGQYESVLWQVSSKVPLPLVMTMSNLHITHFSSSVIEAANFAIPSAILDPHIKPDGKHRDFYRHEIESGIAEVVEIDSCAIIKFINRRLRGSLTNVRSGFSQADATAFLREKLGVSW